MSSKKTELDPKMVGNDHHDAREKQQFYMHNLIHDLKTPLTMLKGYLENLIDGVVEVDEVDDYHQRMMVRVDSMIEMLKDIPNEKKDDDRVTMEVQDLVLGMLARFQDEVRVHNMHLLGLISPEIKEKKLVVKVDYHHIERVYANLIANAICYTPEKSCISLQAYVQDGYVVFLVSDEGCGVHGEDIPMLFEPFFKGKNCADFSNASHQGLGLSIAKEIIERHAGQIGVMEDEIKGATFYFTLPIGDGSM